jgi:iron complex outermembrane recepter protein
MRFVSRASSRVLELVVAALLAASGSLPAFALEVHRFEIPEEDAALAIRDFGAQAHVQILVAGENVRDKRLHAVSGNFTTEDALNTLLIGSGLTHKYVGDKSVALLSVAQAQANTVPGSSQPAVSGKEGRGSPESFLVAQAAAGQAASTPSLEERETPERKASQLQEVVVTAQRREERLQSVPISVTVFDQATMDAQGTRSIDDLARLTPAITFTHQSTNNNAQNSDIAIRGINSQAGAATTGIYIDDTPIQTRHLSFGSFNTYPELFDIERVEVLEGPQGTLFGSGSEGGTVRFITPEPSLTQASVYARSGIAATSHGDPVYELGAAAGVPLINDTLGLRASASYRHDGGYIDRVDWRTGQVVSGSANASRTVTARVALKWAATENFTVAPSVYYQKRDIDDTSAWWYIRPDLAPGDPTNGLFNSPLRSGNELASPDSDKFVLAALKLEWALGPVQLFSNTSYFKRDQAATTDYSQFDRAIFLGNPYPPAGEVGTGYWVDAQENWTQEFRIQSSDPQAKVLWTAGLFYQHAHETTRQNVYDPSLQTDLGLPPDFNDGYIYREDPRVGIDKQIALFGQADIKLTEPLKLTLGLRYAYAQFEGEAHYPTTLVVGPGFDSVGSETEHPVTPKVGLTYQINKDDLVYITAAKGFRIGGANPAVGQFCYGPGGALEMIGLTAVPPTYGSDSLWSYEIGSKNSFAENRILLNASAYYIKWKDIQQNVPLTACGFQYTGNLGEARSTGFDLQAVANLTQALSVGANFSYIDAQYTKTVQLEPTVFSIVQDGDRLPAAPWAVSAFAQATIPLAGSKAYARVDYRYSAKQSGTVAAANPLNGGFPAGFDPIPSQSFTSLRAGLNRGAWDVSLYAQNLFDTHPRLGGAMEILAPYSLYTAYSYRPRTVGLTGTYHY